MYEIASASEELSLEEKARLRHAAHVERLAIERELFRRPSFVVRSRSALLRAIGAAAVGVFAAGCSILAIVILLNLFFHYTPGPS